MSRIRTIKPEFFRSRSLARCSRDARLTFEGLWCEADDHGRGICDARLLKGAIWALDDDIDAPTIDAHLAELEREHILIYEVDGERYYAILNWEKHQAAAYRRGEPIHPAPPVVRKRARKCKEVPDAREVVLEHGTGNIEHGREQGSELALVTVTPVDEVFYAWQESTGKHRANLDAKRRRVITAALKEYPLEDVIDAVRGWRHSPHHRGENERRTVYNDIELLLRDAARIEQFRDLERGQNLPPPKMPDNFSSIERAVAAAQGANR